MRSDLENLIYRIKRLEQELLQELQKKQEEFYYTIDQKKVHFQREVKERHRLLVWKLRRYLLDASPFNLLTAPIIWVGLFPALFMDLFVTTFQAICFPIYQIPKVEREKFIIIDRHALAYLNIIEKTNCVYCGYFSGLIAYTQEVASRTEQYWCPIKHARRMQTIHNRYKYFFDYGDAEAYRKELEKVRRAFDDLDNETNNNKALGNT
jgi:hypothetical protein